MGEEVADDPDPGNDEPPDSTVTPMRATQDGLPPPRAQAAMTSCLWYMLVLFVLPIGWLGHGMIIAGGRGCSAPGPCAADIVRGLVIGWAYELFAMIVLFPVMLIPLGASGVVVGVFARSHDPVKVGRAATLTGILCLVLPLAVLYRMQLW